MHFSLYLALIGLAGIGADAVALRRDTPRADERLHPGSRHKHRGGKRSMNAIMDHLDQNGHVDWINAGSEQFTTVPVDMFDAAAANLSGIHPQDVQGRSVDPSLTYNGCEDYVRNHGGDIAKCGGYPDGFPATAAAAWVGAQKIGDYAVRVLCNEDKDGKTMAKNVLAKQAKQYCRTLVASNTLGQVGSHAWQLLKEDGASLAALLENGDGMPDVYEEICRDAFHAITLLGICDKQGDQSGFTGQTHGAYIQIGEHVDVKASEFAPKGTLTFAFDPIGKLDDKGVIEVPLNVTGQ